ncbi:hypothetical protein [Sulfobacillus harzensis]|uniref:Uncharacterized protein n=1 Tax=Sulfobacillus harzensis TaxID=2729629 RepID=A0A7Y0L779_9FIRM|nr:hypothetical protein [Sulfobacillus harzensis]NMP24599.1 hypothetical protein [Sulfobacillus harzensis]
MNRTRVFALVVTATTEDANFLESDDLSEVATVMSAALARGVESLEDLTLYEILASDGPDSTVWAEIQDDARQQLNALQKGES